MRLLVTGGAGFIGSAVIRTLIAETSATVVNVDKLTYAGNLLTLAPVARSDRYHFEQADICDASEMRQIFFDHSISAVMHLAAESHVDRSIDGAAPFIHSNILGTYALLEVALQYWRGLSSTERENFRFHHVSTDEVYGSLGPEGLFMENSPYRPNSPYAASKASADHLVRAWHHTYGLPVVTSNCSNNYGPYQYPEKLIPLVIARALAGKPIPVYGRGDNVRDWLYVDDHVTALRLVLEEGRIGESYNVGARNEVKNIDLVKRICALIDELVPQSPHSPHAQLIEFVEDRPGHDRRYAIDPTKIESELAWRPRESFSSGLRKTVQWYLENQDWLSQVTHDRYTGERLGLGVSR